ncbi:MAG: SpoIID/LytB domain-containing protein [Planctomycetes bacterium]|nr:SpoIID/LytB domain-containing protein [Planctomycetota bacterium]
MGARLLSRVVALALVAACVAPPPPLAPDRRRASEALEAPPLRRVEERAVTPDWRVDEVRVRLASQERRAEVRVSGTPLGVLEFRREGDAVRSSGGRLAPRFELEPLPGGEGLGVAGRLYPGRLVVEPHGASGLRVTNVVGVEAYVAGVVPAELVLWSAEPAEIEAQAIAARSYALRSYAERRAQTRDAFLWDDTRDQVYVGRFDAGPSAGARRVQARLDAALAASRGRVLLDDAGELFDVRFHASCGGHTTTPARAFPQESTVTRGAVACPPCEAIGRAERALPESDTRTRRVHWSWTASRAELDRLASRLGVGRRLVALRVAARDDYGRWLEVEVVGDGGRRTVDATRLRAELDPAKLKSGLVLRTWPPLGEPTTGGLLFEGLGRGHGAGLCQVGSHELALQGWSARRILNHYLAGAHLGDARAEGARP